MKSPGWNYGGILQLSGKIFRRERVKETPATTTFW